MFPSVHLYVLFILLYLLLKNHLRNTNKLSYDLASDTQMMGKKRNKYNFTQHKLVNMLNILCQSSQELVAK